MRAVSGDADLTVLGVAGHLPEALLTEVLGTPGVRAARPHRPRRGGAGGAPGLGLELVGVDLLAPVERPWAQPPGGLADALGRAGLGGGDAGLGRRAGLAGRRRGGGDQRLAPGGPHRRRARRLPAAGPARLAAAGGDGPRPGCRGSSAPPGRLQQIDVLAATRRGGAGAVGPALGAPGRAGPGRLAGAADRGGGRPAGGLPAQPDGALAGLAPGRRLPGPRRHPRLADPPPRGAGHPAGGRRHPRAGGAPGARRGGGARAWSAPSPACRSAGWRRGRASAPSPGTLRTVYLLEGVDGVRLAPASWRWRWPPAWAARVLGALLPALDASRRDPRALLSPITLTASSERSAAGRWRSAGSPALAAARAAPRSPPAARWRPSGFVLALGAPRGGPARRRPSPSARLARLVRPRRLGAAPRRADPRRPPARHRPRRRRPGGGGLDAGRRHRHGRQLPRDGDRLARPDAAGRRLRHHALLAPRPRRGDARSRAGGAAGRPDPASARSIGSARWRRWWRAGPPR